MESNYCKICNLYTTCQKSKTCSCTDFVTDVQIRNGGRKTPRYC